VFGSASAVSQQPSEPAVGVAPPTEAPFVFGSVRESLPRFDEGLLASSKLPDKMEKLNLRTSGDVGDGLGQGRDRKDGSSAFGVDISGLFSNNKEANVVQEKLTQLNLGHREPLQSEKRDSANGVPQAFVFGGNGAGSFGDCKNTVGPGAHSDALSSVHGTDAKAAAGKSMQFNIGSQAPSRGGGIDRTNGAPEAFTFRSTAVSDHVDNINSVDSGANTSSSTVSKGVGGADLLPEKLTQLSIGSDMPLHEMKSGYQPKVFTFGSGGVSGAVFGKETGSTSDRSSEFFSANSNTSSSSSDFLSTANSNASNSANGTYCLPPEKTPDLNAGDGVMLQSLESDNSNCPLQTFLFQRNETQSSVSHSASIAMDDGGNFVNDENTDTCSSRGTVECAGALPEKMTKLNIGCGVPYHSRKDETATEPPEVFVFGRNVSSFSSAQTASKSNDPTSSEFCFESKAEATSGYGAVPQNKVQESYPFTNLNNSCSSSTFENVVPAFSFGATNAETETAPDDHFSVKQDLPGYSRETLFGLDSIKSAYKEKREARKGKMKNKRPTSLKQHAQLHQDVSKEASTNGEASDLAGDYSPMDCSPYPAEAEHVPTEAYVASDQPVHIGDSVISNWNTSCAEDDVVSATEHLVLDADLPMFGDEGRGPKLDASEINFGSSFSSFEGDRSNSSQHSFTNIGQDCNENTYRTPHDFVEAAAFQSSSSNLNGLNFRFGVSTYPQISAAAQRRNTRRKLRTKGSLASKPSTINSFEQPKSSQDTKGMQFFCETSKNQDSVKEQPSRDSSISVALETCETWRTSGNNAYANGHFATAEDYYTRGINSVIQYGVSGHCSRALMLCYSNRAATRMSLGMMSEALQDCLTATSIDPTFLKAKVRAANCQLALGDLEDASRSYMSCLNSNTGSSDPKIFAEASDGLERVKRVTDWVSQCKELLEKRTSPEATKALELISNALHICPHSDSLKEMKADALLMLRRFEEVIQLCQESVNPTERNSVLFKDNGEPKNSRVSEQTQFSGRYWRPYLICKSYFLSGKLDEALELLKKHEQVTPVKESEVSTYQEKFSSLSATVRELLSLKAAGNESFQAGRYSDAVKQYSAALACNSESRPFSAVCFCNRAAAYQALGQVTDAIADCSLAMVLDTNYPKAISRRATLYEMIRDYDQAANDVRKLISLLEKKVNVSGVSPKAFNKHKDLKQAHARLSSIEDEAKNDIPLNLYLILGVEPSCSSEDIKKAYRKAALRHHPDKAAQLLVRNENAEDGFWRDIVKEVYADADHLFKTIGEAYNVLSDPGKREEYNFEEDLRNARRRVSSSRSMHRSPEQNYSNRGFNPRQWQSSRASRSRWYSNSDDYYW